MKRLLALSTLALLSSLAFADDAPAAGPGNGPGNGACKADIEKLCPGVQPGGGRIAACLKEHKDQVSDTCKAAIKKMRARHATQGDSGSDNPSGN